MWQAAAAAAVHAAAVLTHPGWLATAISLLVLVPWLRNRWRFRHIPGPFAPPLLGNLPGIAAMELHGFLDACRQRYGPIFKLYIGAHMIVCIAEPTAARRMLSKQNTRHTGLPLLAGPRDWDFLTDGLVGANGPAWHTLRSAWTPAFSAAALASYTPAMHACVEQLLDRLAAAAASGEAVDLSTQLCATTLAMVGEAAYGVDLQAMQQTLDASLGSSHSSPDSSSLQGAVKAVFEGGGVANSSSYTGLMLLFPAAAPLVQWLAYRFPDARLRRLARARALIRRISLQLVRLWRPPAPATSALRGVGSQDTGSSSKANGGMRHSSSTAPLKQQQQQQQQQQQPGTFPAVMLAARDKHTGAPLSDECITAQLNSFLVAAFDTTASTVAFCVYFIAQHAHVEARLLQELDAWQQQGDPGAEELPYLNAVVQETLRLLPPGAIATRTAGPTGHHLTDSTGSSLRPLWLPPGTAMFAGIWCFHRDPELWPSALEFLPERWLPEGEHLRPANDAAYAPFGAGGRLCIGRPLAMQAVALMLRRLYASYTLTLEPGQVPLQLKQTFALVPRRGLHVRATKRQRL